MIQRLLSLAASLYCMDVCDLVWWDNDVILYIQFDKESMIAVPIDGSVNAIDEIHRQISTL